MDFFIDENGEVKEDETVNYNRVRYQDLFCRIYSIKGDFVSSKNYGANTETILGSFVTSDSHIKKLEDEIVGILKKDDIFIDSAKKEFEQGLTVYLKDAYSGSTYKMMEIGFYGTV